MENFICDCSSSLVTGFVLGGVIVFSTFLGLKSGQKQEYEEEDEMYAYEENEISENKSAKHKRQ